MGKPIRKQDLEPKFVQLLTEIRDLAKTSEEILILISEDYVSDLVKKKLYIVQKEVKMELDQKWVELEKYFVDISICNCIFIGLKKYNCLGRVTDILTELKQLSVILEPPVLEEWDITDEINVAEDLAEIIVFVVAKEI